jgi:feruloyl esterase
LGSGPGGGGGSNYASNYFRYMVTGDATWSALTANVDDSLRMAIEKTSKALDSTNPDLGPFAARGGKLLVYHGWNDPAISPWNTINYWNSVQQKMGSDNASKVMQLYMVPGMEHCASGPGPSNFGQFGLPPAAGPGSGALDLLQLWVENGRQPQMILASKTIRAKTPAGEEAAPASIVRPLCAYPQQARYNGTGDPNHPTSFRCAN